MEAELIDVVSRDGSSIGVERLGSGPPLIAVHGGTADRTRWGPVREALAESYTVHLVDRRGRGASLAEAEGEYALAREVEDLQAVLDLVGDAGFYLGHSYGALVGIDLLRADDRVAKALLYEPPFDAGGLQVIPPDFLDRYAELIADDRRDDALDLFYTEVIGLDPTPLHALPVWQARRIAAHTLVREGVVAATYVPDREALAGVTVPTLVLTGSASPPVFGAAARITVDALPNATLRVIEGQGHTMIDADPEGFVRLVRDVLR